MEAIEPGEALCRRVGPGTGSPIMLVRGKTLDLTLLNAGAQRVVQGATPGSGKGVMDQW